MKHAKALLVGSCVAVLGAGTACNRADTSARTRPVECGALATSAELQGLQIGSVTEVAASETLPAYCEVQANIVGADGSRVGVVYRLPVEWNGKLLGLGGGGWMGNVTLQAATEGLQRGYATLQTDAGHTTGTGFDASEWALKEDGSANQPALEDFSHRAIHLMTVHGKQVVATRYGQQASRAYYQGCSTGGRMGMMETQRYPEDFDGVIAGAPVYTLQTQTSAVLRTRAFAAPGARLQAGHLELLNKAVLAACDGEDGAVDGVLRDPRACGFDPGTLQCKAGQQGAQCLTAPQVQAVRSVYAGEQTSDGSVASWPLERGSELQWMRFVPATEPGDPGTNSGGLQALRGPLLGDPAFDLDAFEPDDVRTVRSSWLAQVYEAANPDISAFARRGGKLLLWHGVNDPGPSMRATLAYYEQARQVTSGAQEAIRLLLAPGVAHCRGGAGPDEVDWLGAMERWVEDGQPPAQLPASKRDDALAWNLCAYPELPTGQPDGSYACQ